MYSTVYTHNIFQIQNFSNNIDIKSKNQKFVWLSSELKNEDLKQISNIGLCMELLIHVYLYLYVHSHT